MRNTYLKNPHLKNLNNSASLPVGQNESDQWKISISVLNRAATNVDEFECGNDFTTSKFTVKAFLMSNGVTKLRGIKRFTISIRL